MRFTSGACLLIGTRRRESERNQDCRVVTQRAVKNLIPHPLNAKVYGDVAPDRELLASIEKNGVITPIIVDRDKHIISGHRRWLAAKELGFRHIPALRFDGTALEAEELLIEANRQRSRTAGQIARETSELFRIESELSEERRNASLIQNTSNEVAVVPHEGTSVGRTRDIVASKTGHLRETLGQRIQEIQDTIGEDSAILDPAEKVNQEAMYAIYDDKPTNLDLFEPEEPMGLGEAEGILRQLRADDPAEFDRIASLRDGLRSGMDSLTPGIFVLCQAGDFQQLFFVDPKGEIETRDASTILGRIKCSPSTPTAVLPADYNASVMKVYQLFADETALRKTTLEHRTSLSVGQRYVLQELKPFAATLDEDDPRQTDAAILQRAYSSHALSAAVQTELRRVRNHKLTAESLFVRLRDIYDQHRLSQVQEQVRGDRQVAVPHIVCSEVLV